GAGARDVGQQRGGVLPQEPGGDDRDAGRLRGVRDDRGVGVVLDAGARPAAFDRDRRGARLQRQGPPPAGGVRGGGGSRGDDPPARGGAREAAGGPEVPLRVRAQRRVELGARADGAGGARALARGGVQPERLPGAPLGRARRQRGGGDVQAAGAGGAAGEDGALSG